MVLAGFNHFDPRQSKCSKFELVLASDVNPKERRTWYQSGSLEVSDHGMFRQDRPLQHSAAIREQFGSSEVPSWPEKVLGRLACPSFCSHSHNPGR